MVQWNILVSNDDLNAVSRCFLGRNTEYRVKLVRFKDTEYQHKYWTLAASVKECH